MNNIAIDKTITSEIGMFAVIDPCYLLDKEIYHEQWGDMYGYEEGVFELENGDTKANFFVGGTAYGDGSYYGWSSSNIRLPRYGFCVDSGTIAVIPAELWKGTSEDDKEQIYEFGTIIEATALRCEVDGGEFTISGNNSRTGSIVLNISTAEMEDEEEDEYEEEYDSCYDDEDEEGEC